MPLNNSEFHENRRSDSRFLQWAINELSALLVSLHGCTVRQ